MSVRPVLSSGKTPPLVALVARLSHQVHARRGHAPARARRTHRSRTATERHEELVPATRAPDAREPVPRVSTAQQPPELALDVLRKRLAIALARVLQERLQVLAHQPVQHLALRLAPLVLEALLLGSRGCSGGHNRLPKPSACQQRSAEICRKCATRGWRPPLSTGGPPPVPSPLCSSSSLNAASSCTRSRFGTTHCLSRAGNRPRSTARRRSISSIGTFAGPSPSRR